MCFFLTVPWLWSYLIFSAPAVKLINTPGSRKQTELAPQEKNITVLSSRIIVMNKDYKIVGYEEKTSLVSLAEAEVLM